MKTRMPKPFFSLSFQSRLKQQSPAPIRPINLKLRHNAQTLISGAFRVVVDRDRETPCRALAGGPEQMSSDRSSLSRLVIKNAYLRFKLTTLPTPRALAALRRSGGAPQSMPPSRPEPAQKA